MTLISSLMFLVFSIMGLSMLYLSQVYLKLGSFKKNSILLEYATENGIKQGFHQLTQLITDKNSPKMLSAEITDLLKTETKAGEIKTVAELLGIEIPLSCSDIWNNLQWKAETRFSINEFQEAEDYIRISYGAAVLSEGTVLNFRQNRISSLSAAFDVWAGFLPLPTIPFLLDKKITREQQKDFTDKHAIEISGAQSDILRGEVSFSPGELLPEAATDLISKALKINIFYPQDLSHAKLRQVLGLDAGDEPVPQGVYLIRDDLGLGGVFIKGDLDEMVFAIDHGAQVISFRSQAGQWVLKFTPTDSETIFIKPDGTEYFNFLPLGIIIIDGQVNSLGGGIVDQTGSVIMIRDIEIPCILSGVNLTVISSDRITISSHLIHEGVKWEEGVPYIKNADSQLQIFATGQDIQGTGETEGEILIASDSSEELKIQASLTASGKGISIEGENRIIHLLGSIQTSNYVSNGNALQMVFDDRFATEEKFLENAPKSTKPIFRISSYKAVEWQEY